MSNRFGYPLEMKQISLWSRFGCPTFICQPELEVLGAKSVTSMKYEKKKDPEKAEIQPVEVL